VLLGRQLGELQEYPRKRNVTQWRSNGGVGGSGPGRSRQRVGKLLIKNEYNSEVFAFRKFRLVA